MKRLRYILLTILALLLVIPLVWSLRPEGSMDFSQEEEPFKSLVLPLKSIIGDFNRDGGSLTIQLTDKTGIIYLLDFDIDRARVPNNRPTVYYMTSTGLASPSKDPARAKAISIRLLRDYGSKENEKQTRQAIDALSDPVGEVVERLYDKSKTKLDEWTGF